jgi:hypothetical protein
MGSGRLVSTALTCGKYVRVGDYGVKEDDRHQETQYKEVGEVVLLILYTGDGKSINRMT